MFLFFAYGGVMVGKTALGGDPSTTSEYLVFLLFGAVSFGASLTINAWIFYRVTGGLFNPAVSIVSQEAFEVLIFVGYLCFCLGWSYAPCKV
jgi:glycerol uptake facilitator-like aquaporin